MDPSLEADTRKGSRATGGKGFRRSLPFALSDTSHNLSSTSLCLPGHCPVSGAGGGELCVWALPPFRILRAQGKSGIKESRRIWVVAAFPGPAKPP